jgi:hypothetical protein
MGLFDFLKSKNKRDEEEEGMAILMALTAHRKAMRADSVDSDSLPTGYGPFGLCVTNPIPTKNVLGSNAYLAALRTIENGTVDATRIGSVCAPDEVTTAMIDVYKIISAGNKIAMLYVCPYHKKNSAKAPEGFILVGET